MAIEKSRPTAWQSILKGTPVRYCKPTAYSIMAYKTAYTQRCTLCHNQKTTSSSFFAFALCSFCSFTCYLHTANHASKPTTPTTARTAWEKPLLSMGTTYVLSTPECLSTVIALGPSSSHTSIMLSSRSRLHRYLFIYIPRRGYDVWVRRSHDTR